MGGHISHAAFDDVSGMFILNNEFDFFDLYDLFDLLTMYLNF